MGNPEDRFCQDSAHLSAMFSVHLALQIGMIAQSEARQRGMQATKGLTPHIKIILSLRFRHKMIYMTSTKNASIIFDMPYFKDKHL